MGTTSERRQCIATFYVDNANELQRLVARHVNAPAATIEDACQTAWATLVRRPDVTLDRRGLRWLQTVATREAWRLASTAHEIPVGAFLRATTDDDAEQGTMPEPPGDMPGPLDQVAARLRHTERVEHLRRLKPREREALYLKAVGYRYQEIATLTGSTYTAVTRRITEGRARLRRLAASAPRPSTRPAER
jgi:DNA-directed RNA polymerase specialized sigma24 family protein